MIFDFDGHQRALNDGYRAAGAIYVREPVAYPVTIPTHEFERQCPEARGRREDEDLAPRVFARNIFGRL